MNKQIVSPIIVALDYADPLHAMAMIDQLDPSRCRVKMGKELFTRGGPQLVEKVVAKGYDVFLDLKYHDIPNTVAGACSAAAMPRCMDGQCACTRSAAHDGSGA